MALPSGTRLGRYEVLSQLGAGGMGEVYLARDTTELDRLVAVKVLPAAYAGDPERMRRFVQEAKSASSLNHPNILTVHEIGQANGTRFIATEYVEGETLRQKLVRSPLTLHEALDVAIQIAAALVAAHKAGITHRDIKPENVIVRADGIVKVVDFGLAKLTERQAMSPVDASAPTKAATDTHPGVVMGTAQYMSPEQARGLVLDARTDFWSLGVVLYEMVARRPPFEGRTSSDVISSVLRMEPPALTVLSAEADARLDEIVTKALTKDREERYQSAKDLLIDLKRLKQHLTVDAEIERTAAPAWRSTSSGARRISDRHGVAAAGEPSAHAATEPARPASSAEYVVKEITRHKKGTLVVAAIAAIAVTAAILFDRGPRALTEQDTILLTDFVNTTGEAVFDDMLKQALTVHLSQSPFLNIFSEDRVREALRFMGRSREERVTRVVGRELCQRQGLKAMLSGSIASMGSHYVITIEAIDAVKGDTLASEQVEAESKERVLHALGEAATKLREQLGESLASIQKFDAPIEQATTTSLEAFKAYTLGVEQHRRGAYLDAVPFYKRAIELDPNFALAYARLGAVYVNTRQFGLAAEASRQAYDLRDRISERERLFIAANYYDDVTREMEKKIETLELWKRTYPRDYVPHNNLALQYNNVGEYEKAVEEAREAIALHPTGAPAHSNLAQAFLGLNRVDEAKQVIERALAQKIETMWMRRNLYLMAVSRGEAAAAKEQIEWAKGKPEEYAAQRWQGEVASFSGQQRKSREFYDRAVELALRRDLKDVAAELIVQSAMRGVFFGDCSQVKGQTARALAISQSYSPRILAANALASCGEFSRTQAITDDMGERFPKDTLLTGLFLPLIKAQGELYRGNAVAAIHLLEPAVSYERVPFPISIPYLRGQAYLSDQKGAEAAAEFQKVIDGWAPKGWPISPLYPLAQVGLARAAVLTGDIARARTAYQDFLALWKDADAEIPILQAARREYEKLTR